MKFADDTVAGLRCPEGRKDVFVADAHTKGFWVRVQANGVRTFIYRYKLAGLSRRIPLGTFGEVTTAKARKEAERLRGLVLAGRDPWGERKREAVATVAAEREARTKAERDAFTVKDLIALYAEKHVAKLRPATQRDVLSRLRLHLRPIADKPVAAIGRADAARVVDRAAQAGDTTARRVRDYARAMWRWAGDRGTLPDAQTNPWETAPAPGKDVPRERVLTADELGHVWRATGTLASPYGPMVRFLIVTLARRQEASDVTWGEIAPDLSQWVIPGSRMKRGQPHVVMLPEPAKAILRSLLGAEEGKPLPALPPSDRFVFGLFGNKAITSHSWVKRQLDAAIAEARAKAAAEAELPEPKPMPAWVIHDMRHTAVTTLARMGFDLGVADKLLAHQPSNLRGAGRVYQHYDFAEERARALEAWAAHVTRCADEKREAEAGKVAILAERRARRKRA